MWRIRTKQEQFGKRKMARRVKFLMEDGLESRLVAFSEPPSASTRLENVISRGERLRLGA
jgi:hypothetical protein